MPRILVIDDDPPMRLTLQRILESAGHTAVVAADGGKGITLQEATPADLIIADVIMPEKEGFETIREIRSRWPATKIIAISGGMSCGNVDVLAIARMFGAARTVAKPFKPEEILTAVRDLLATPAS